MGKNLSSSEKEILTRASGEMDSVLKKKVAVEISKDDCLRANSNELDVDNLGLDSEISAIYNIALVVEPLPACARRRVLRWAVDRFLPTDWHNV